MFELLTHFKCFRGVTAILQNNDISLQNCITLNNQEYALYFKLFSSNKIHFNSHNKSVSRNICWRLVFIQYSLWISAHKLLYLYEQLIHRERRIFTTFIMFLAYLTMNFGSILSVAWCITLSCFLYERSQSETILLCLKWWSSSLEERKVRRKNIPFHQQPSEMS